MKTKKAIFMVDFSRPSHIYHVLISKSLLILFLYHFRSLVFGRRSAPMAALLRSTAPELADAEYMKQSGLTPHWTVHGILCATGIRTRDGK